jgi:hypothetical protein
MASAVMDTLNLRNHSFICPYPLVYADSTKEYPAHYTTHWAYKHGNCAVRCPTIVLTVDEFDHFNHNVWIIAMIACLFSFTVLAFHLPEASRYNIRIIFVAGFAAGSFAFAAFAPLNSDYKLICSDDRAHYIEQHPLCILQSSLIVSSYVWIALWGAIYSVDIYLVTSLTDHNKLKQLRRGYLWFAGIVTIAVTCVGLIADNFGYDYTTALPNCMYLFAQNETYFWTTLVLPYVISCIICLLASFGSAYRLQSVFVNSKLSSRRRMLRNVIQTLNRQQPQQITETRGVGGGGGGRRNLNSTDDCLSQETGEETEQEEGQGQGKGEEGQENQLHHQPQKEEPSGQEWNDHSDNRRKPLDLSSGDSQEEWSYQRRSDVASSSNPLLHSRQPLPIIIDRSSTHSILPSSLPPTNTPYDIASSPSESSQAMSSFNIELKEEDPSRITEQTLQPDHEDDYIVSIISEEYLSELRNSFPRLHSQFTCTSIQTRTDDTVTPTSTSTRTRIPSNPSATSANGNGRERSISEETREREMLPASAANALIRQISEKIIETWKYNGRIILFIFVYCLLSVYVIPVFVYLFHLTYDQNVDSAEDYIACLITASVLSPIQTQDNVDQYSESECGRHPSPRPPFGLVGFHLSLSVCLCLPLSVSVSLSLTLFSVFSQMVSVNYWAAGFGIIPAIIFGSIFLEKFQKWFRATFNPPLSTPLLRENQ